MKNHYDRRSELNGPDHEYPNEYKHSPEMSFMEKLGFGLVLLSGAMILVGMLGTKLFPEIAEGLILVGVMLLGSIGIFAPMFKG